MCQPLVNKTKRAKGKTFCNGYLQTLRFSNRYDKIKDKLITKQLKLNEYSYHQLFELTKCVHLMHPVRQLFSLHFTTYHYCLKYLHFEI